MGCSRSLLPFCKRRESNPRVTALGRPRFGCVHAFVFEVSSKTVPAVSILEV